MYKLAAVTDLLATLRQPVVAVASGLSTRLLPSPLSWVPPTRQSCDATRLRSRRETEMSGYASEVGETEMHGDVSEFALATSRTTAFNHVFQDSPPTQQ